MPETVRLWSELSGIKVAGFRPDREGWIVNDCYYIYQDGGDIYESIRSENKGC